MDRAAERSATGGGVAPVLAVIAANVALAFGPLFVRMADTGPTAAGFWRMALAVPVLFAVAFARGGAPMAQARGLGPILLVSGLVFSLDLAFWHLGIVRTTLANSTLFGNSASFIYPIYGFLVARAWPSRQQGVALLIAAVGGGLLLGRSAELAPENLAGDLLSLLAGVMYATYFILMSRVRARMPAISSLAFSSLASVAPLLALALLLGERIMPGDWTPILLLTLVSQLIGQGLLIYAIGHLTPLVVGLALLLQPAVAAAIGWIAFDERLGLLDFVGAGLVCLALVLVRRPAVAPRPGVPRS